MSQCLSCPSLSFFIHLSLFAHICIIGLGNVQKLFREPAHYSILVGKSMLELRFQDSVVKQQNTKTEFHPVCPSVRMSKTFYSETIGTKMKFGICWISFFFFSLNRIQRCSEIIILYTMYVTVKKLCVKKQLVLTHF